MDDVAGAHGKQATAGSVTECALVYCGPVAPEVLAAHAALAKEIPGRGVLAITSSDRLYHDWRPRWASR